MDKYSFDDLQQIMEKLRGENGCPWDKEQNFQSLKKYVLEEAYEVVDSIDGGDSSKHCEELGDLLLQIVFQSQIAKEDKKFTIEDVVNSICTKLINRHPHVFGDVILESADQVEQSWQENKLVEKKISTYTENLKDVPNGMSALIKGSKVLKRASKIDFAWEKPEVAFELVEKNYKKLKELVNLNDNDGIRIQIGNLIFSIINVSRLYKVDPETEVLSTINQFINNFETLENNTLKTGVNLKDISTQDLDKLWRKIKE